MELEAVKGRNQRGISFVHPSVTAVRTALLSYQGVEVYTDIRTSEQVDSGSLIIDSRIFDELACEEHCEISLTAVPEEIPDCNELALLVDSLQGLDNKKVVDEVSKQVEDLKEHLDGLIVRLGQRIDVAGLGLRLVVDKSKPIAKGLQVSRIIWNQLLKVNLTALAEVPSCFNICYAIDVGASSEIDDVEVDDEPHRKTRLEAGLSAIQSILSSAHACPNALVSAIAFGESPQQIESVEDVALELNSKSFNPIHEWLSTQNDDRKDEPSNPGKALEMSLRIANELRSQNHLPTVVLLISGGAFTSGRNPVSVARTIGATDGVSVSCVALGTESDLVLMQAIADAGSGSLIHIGQYKDVKQVIERIFVRISGEAVGK
ncbi:MAG: vWA domain-containing protein [Candidatus Thorarchaeota archaeon]